jgi:hypothetical protein
MRDWLETLAGVFALAVCWVAFIVLWTVTP